MNAHKNQEGYLNVGTLVKRNRNARETKITHKKNISKLKLKVNKNSKQSEWRGIPAERRWK